MDNRQKGALGEEAAASYLEKNGYKILSRNYRAGRGEIDIIAQKGDIISFVEVKTRTTLLYGTPGEAVTFSKRRAIIKTAMEYISRSTNEGMGYSFDIIEVYAGEGGRINHIKNAFDADGR